MGGAGSPGRSVSLGVHPACGLHSKVGVPSSATRRQPSFPSMRRCAGVLVEVFLGVHPACGSLRKVERPCKVTVNQEDTTFLFVDDRRCAEVLVEVFLGVHPACGSLRKVKLHCTVLFRPRKEDISVL
uniref:Uncharacterized protein n=1 Tax=Molossus molossus TaxID=27622 RepID=A0A7J8BLD2_MOLMO|nr:hypothetical protein HJG59_010181 [Molossus molossus]